MLTQLPLKYSFQPVRRSSYGSFIMAAEQNNTIDDTAARLDYYHTPFDLLPLWRDRTLHVDVAVDMNVFKLRHFFSDDAEWKHQCN